MLSSGEEDEESSHKSSPAVSPLKDDDATQSDSSVSSDSDSDSEEEHFKFRPWMKKPQEEEFDIILSGGEDDFIEETKEPSPVKEQTPESSPLRLEEEPVEPKKENIEEKVEKPPKLDQHNTPDINKTVSATPELVTENVPTPTLEKRTTTPIQNRPSTPEKIHVQSPKPIPTLVREQTPPHVPYQHPVPLETSYGVSNVSQYRPGNDTTQNNGHLATVSSVQPPVHVNEETHRPYEQKIPTMPYESYNKFDNVVGQWSRQRRSLSGEPFRRSLSKDYKNTRENRSFSPLYKDRPYRSNSRERVWSRENSHERFRDKYLKRRTPEKDNLRSNSYDRGNFDRKRSLSRERITYRSRSPLDRYTRPFSQEKSLGGRGRRYSPVRGNSPYRRNSPTWRSNSLKRNDSPYRRNDSPYRRNSPVRRTSPVRRNSPLRSNSPYRRNSPCRQRSPVSFSTYIRITKPNIAIYY